MTLTTSRLITALAALSIAAVAAGCSCGGDDYYCDDTGCYYCDGLGCREADAPPRASCTGDWQCEADQVCTEDGCTPRCGLDEQCADGTVCIDSGFCMPPGSAEPVLHPGLCASSEECGDGGLCQDGLCIADPGLPDDGTDDPVDDPSDPSDPGGDEEVPVGPAPQCTHQTDCPVGWDCMNAICKLGCTEDAQCGLGCECSEDGWCSGPGYTE